MSEASIIPPLEENDREAVMAAIHHTEFNSIYEVTDALGERLQVQKLLMDLIIMALPTYFQALEVPPPPPKRSQGDQLLITALSRMWSAWLSS